MQSGVRIHTFLHGSFSAYVTKSRLSQVSLEDILCSGFRRTAYFEKGYGILGLQWQKEAENQSVQAISIHPQTVNQGNLYIPEGSGLGSWGQGWGTTPALESGVLCRVQAERRVLFPWRWDIVTWLSWINKHGGHWTHVALWRWQPS